MVSCGGDNAMKKGYCYESEKAGKSGINTRFTSLSMQSQRKMCEIDQPHNNGATDPKLHMLH